MNSSLNNDIYALNFLKQYNITHNGFLPEASPLEKFPFEESRSEDLTLQLSMLDNIAENLHNLNKSDTLREQVHNLPIIDVSSLNNYELERMYSILSLITHSYIWNTVAQSKNDIVDKIPKQLAIPWHASATSLGIVPVLTHAAVDLYNWKLIDEYGPIELDNMRCIHTMTGTMDEEWFFLIMTDVEKKAFPVLFNLVKIGQLLKNNTTNNEIDEQLCEYLNEIAQHITVVLKIMGHHWYSVATDI